MRGFIVSVETPSPEGRPPRSGIGFHPQPTLGPARPVTGRHATPKVCMSRSYSSTDAAYSVMEWGSIVGSWDTPGQPGVWHEGPSLGSLPAGTARSLAEVLQTFTQTPDKCHFGYWEGAGYIDVPEHHPCLPMRARNMVLFAGGIAHADIQFGATPRFPVGESAHLWWPEDRAW